MKSLGADARRIDGRVTQRVDKCKTMDSKKVPLWLHFINADPVGDDVIIISKCCDDLRQDQLTLQILKIMERRWDTRTKPEALPD